VGPNERARTSKTSRKPSKAHSATYQAFVFFAVFAIVTAVLGAGRVWMSVQAAQASIDCGKLQTAIKTARYEGDMLEIQASALSAPSRVQAIAQGQLGMAPATSVSYMHITAGPKEEQVALAPQPEKRESAVLNTIFGVAATQARMLLVGDVGLSSSR
jgi:cell division protein FtsL